MIIGTYSLKLLKEDDVEIHYKIKILDLFWHPVIDFFWIKGPKGLSVPAEGCCP